MVHIKFTARPINTNVSSEVESMASDEVLETSAQQREASTEATPSHSVESNRESQSDSSEDSETTSDDSRHLKVAVVAASAGITYDYGSSGVTKAHTGLMENYARYFPKGYDRAPGVKLVPEPRANDVVVFDDFFIAGLCMPPHPVLVDILRKFRVQLHQLMLNAIIQIGKFI
jgi:hypothetical protein